MISQALELHSTDAFPTMILMNRRTRGQLQRSRTVTLNGNGKSGTGSQEGNIARTSEALKVARTTLYDKLKKYGMI